MNGVQFTVSAILLLSLLCAVALLVYAFRRRRLLSTRYFFPLTLSAIVYAFGYLCSVNSTAPEQARFWSYFQYLAIPFQPYLWLMMTLEYLEIPKKLQRVAAIGGLYHPALLLLIFYTNPLHHRYITAERFISNGYFMLRVTEKGILYDVMIVSGTLICLLCVAAYIHAFASSAREHRGGIATMAAALLPPWMAVYATASPLNTLLLDYLPVATVLSVLLYMAAMFRFRMFRFIPIAYEKVFRTSGEGILLADMTGRIIDANGVMTGLYPELASLPGEMTLPRFAEGHAELAGLLTAPDGVLYACEAGGGTKHYRAQLTDIHAQSGRNMGQILAVSDVTLLIEHQKRLETDARAARAEAETSELSFLQAQIKPHFLNNTLSVIASMISVEPNEAKALIGRLGEHLADCYYFDSASPSVSLEKELESVDTYVAIEKARFRRRLEYHPAGGDIPPVMIPRLVLQPLVENAIRHGLLPKAGGGHVWLTIRSGEDGIRFEVRDDGVGMPEEKAGRLLLGSGDTRSIGLSNIHTRLQKHYGTGLEIESRPGAGTKVAFCIPHDPGAEGREAYDSYHRAGR